MDKKTCLSCKYEPDWSDWYNPRGKKGFEIKSGECKIAKTISAMPFPACMSVKSYPVVVSFTDVVNLPAGCQKWEPKQ